MTAIRAGKSCGRALPRASLASNLSSVKACMQPPAGVVYTSGNIPTVVSRPVLMWRPIQPMARLTISRAQKGIGNDSVIAPLQQAVTEGGGGGCTCDEHSEQAHVSVDSHKVEQARPHGHGGALPCQAVVHCQICEDAQEAVRQLLSLHASQVVLQLLPLMAGLTETPMVDGQPVTL